MDKKLLTLTIIIIGIYIVGVILNYVISHILIGGIIYLLTNNQDLALLIGWLIFIILGIIGTIYYFVIIGAIILNLD